MVAKKGKTETRKLKNLPRKSVREKQAKSVRGGIIVVCDKTSPLDKTSPSLFPVGPPNLKQ